MSETQIACLKLLPICEKLNFTNNPTRKEETKISWAAALANANYVPYPTSTIINNNFKTPLEMMFRQLPGFNRIKILGNLAFVLNKKTSCK